MKCQEDLDLINCIIHTKDRSAENKLYKKYFNKIFYKVRSFRYDSESAKDIASDIIVKVFTNLNEYSTDKANFNSWVMAITNNHLIDLYRKDKNKIETVSYDAITYDNDLDDSKNRLTADITYNMEDELLIRDNIDYALSSLKENESNLMVLKFYYGYDNEELGYHYNTTNDGISLKINYIKKKFKKYDTI